MRIEPLGETAYILRDLEVEPHILAKSIELAGVPGVEEVVPSMETVGVYVNPEMFDSEKLFDLKLSTQVKGRTFTIPVVFDGLDLHEVSRLIGIEPEFLVKFFCDEIYTVIAIGFLPGFPYLRGLPEILSKLPRRSEPRIHVPEGAVGIAAGQAGIYPQVSPGGWNLLGTTPLKIADGGKQFFPINPGDSIKFSSLGASEAEALKGKTVLDYVND